SGALTMGRATLAPGDRFGRLTVLGDTRYRKGRQIVWLCRCECGSETTVRSANLTRRLTTSCGCYRRQLTRERNHLRALPLRQMLADLATTQGLRIDLPDGAITRHTRVLTVCPKCQGQRATDVGGLLRFPSACRHCSNRIPLAELRTALQPKMIAVGRV